MKKKYHCHSPLMIACEDECESVISVLLELEATVALKNKVNLNIVYD